MAGRLDLGKRKARHRRSIPLAQLSDKPAISLHQAARDGREDVVRHWLNRGPESGRKAAINKRDEHGFTALHYAARFNRVRVIQTLVQNDADPNLKTNEGFTPLHFSATYIPTYQVDEHSQSESTDGRDEATASCQQAMEILVNEDNCVVSPQAKNGQTPLHIACSRGNRAAVEVLLKAQGVQVNLVDEQKHTPLHDAARVGDAWIVERLLQHSADILVENDDGMQPIHFACQSGHVEAAKMILQSRSASGHLLVTVTDAKDNTANTPVHLACDSGSTEIVQSLIDHGAGTATVNIGGLAPMHIAALHGFTDIAEILLKTDPDNISILDRRQQTPLHHAAKHNQPEMVDFLLRKGADMDAVDSASYTPLLSAAAFGKKAAFQHLMSSGASLHAVDKDRKSCVFLAAERNHTDILEVLISDDHGSKLCRGTDTKLNTPLHTAAVHGNLQAIQVLFRASVQIDTRNEKGKMPLHLAAENGHLKVVQALLRYEGENKSSDRTSIIDDGDEDLNTPLHLACSRGHYHVTKYFLELYADPNARNSRLLTPVHCAASNGWDRILELLIEAEAEVDPKDRNWVTPLHLACEKGHKKSAEILIQNGASVTVRRRTNRFNCLDVAIEHGQEDTALAIIQSDQWDAALRNLTEKQDTPMRKLIRRMPAVAELVLNRCMEVNSSLADDPHLEVTINCEFLEDIGYPRPWLEDELAELQSELHEGLQNLGDELQNIGSKISKSLTDLTAPETTDEGKPILREVREEGREREVPQQQSKYWATTWGPPRYKKSNHPLNIMVESKRTELLKHPVVTTLLDYKWRRYTQLTYFLNLSIYLLFVILLTAFALIVYSPEEEICDKVFEDNISESQCATRDRSIYAPYQFRSNREKNESLYDYDNESGYKSKLEFWFLFIAAIVIAFLALTRLMMETFQLLLRRLTYLSDWINWMENFLFASSIVFVWVFNTDCFCTYKWQWQIGTLAVFLAWINLILFAEKIPLTGLYVVMFINIFQTFLRVIILGFLLVLAFGLAFYMLFYDPNADPFLYPFRSPASSLFKTITMTTGEFDFDPLFRQGGDETEEPPYHAVSVILWIIFIVLMPILLMNLLVGLAVGDIQEIQEAATLKRLALQVELALSVEQRMPSRLRQRLLTGEIRAHPNRKLNVCERIMYVFWGGRGYNTEEIIQNALQENEFGDKVVEQAEKLTHEIDELRMSFDQRLKGLEDSLAEISRKLEIPARK